MLRLKSKLVFDSFLYSTQRKSKTKLILTVAFSIIISLFMSVIIATAAGNNPGTLLNGLFTNAIHEPKILIINISIFVIAGLSFIFAYKVGLFNIGITGQMMTAGISCLAIATAIGNNFPQGLSQIFMLFIAMISSITVGMIIILLKVYLNVNEVISSILLNWIVFFMVRLIVAEHYSTPGVEITQSTPFPSSFVLAIEGTKSWFSGGWLPVLIIMILLVIIVTIILKYTVFGKKVISVGSSFTASKYLGINTKAILFSSMAISSAIAGILGYVLYASKTNPVIPVAMTVDALPVEGMNGVAIGLISLCNPIATIPVGIILGWVQTSSSLLVSIPSTVADLINGFVILGAAMFVVFLKFKPWIWMNQWLVCKNYQKNYQKFNNDFDILSSKYLSIYSELKSYLKSIKLSKEVKKYELKLNNYEHQLFEYKRILKVHDSIQTMIDKINKKIKLLETKINNLNKFIKHSNDAIETWTLNISSSEIKALLAQNKKQFINLIYSKYVYELTCAKAQFKKHNLIDKTSQTFWSEFDKQKEKELTLNELNLSKMKTIKKIEDKIYKIEVEMQQKFLQQKNFLFNSLELFKMQLNEKIQKEEKKLELAKKNNEIKIINKLEEKIRIKKQQQKNLVHKKEKNIQEKIDVLDNKFKIIQEEKNAKVPILKQDIINIEKYYKDLENKFISEYDKKVINKKIPKEKLEKVYEKSMKQVQQIQLQKDEKDLLIKWIDESYEHAIKYNGGSL